MNRDLVNENRNKITEMVLNGPEDSKMSDIDES